MNEALPFARAEAMSFHGLLGPMLRHCFPVPERVSVTGLVLWCQSAGNGIRPWEGGAGLKPEEERKKYVDRQ